MNGATVPAGRASERREAMTDRTCQGDRIPDDGARPTLSGRR